VTVSPADPSRPPAVGGRLVGRSPDGVTLRWDPGPIVGYETVDTGTRRRESMTLAVAHGTPVWTLGVPGGPTVRIEAHDPWRVLVAWLPWAL
jgi:hypothetical protein